MRYSKSCCEPTSCSNGRWWQTARFLVVPAVGNRPKRRVGEGVMVEQEAKGAVELSAILVHCVQLCLAGISTGKSTCLAFPACVFGFLRPSEKCKLAVPLPGRTLTSSSPIIHPTPAHLGSTLQGQIRGLYGAYFSATTSLRKPLRQQRARHSPW